MTSARARGLTESPGTAGFRIISRKISWRMKKWIAIGITLAAVAVAGPQAAAGEREPAIRYGTYCMGKYGAMHRAVGIKEAINSLERYFSERGLEAKVTGHDMRFIRADIYNGTDFVDSVVLDSRTGKMRSIY